MIYQPDPDNTGWWRWELTDPERFNASVIGPLIVRDEGNGQARVRMMPAKRHTNLNDRIHGGATLGFIDMALFAASRMLNGIDPSQAMTLDLSTQFIGAGLSDRPLDALVEVLRETGRLAFLRGTVVQGDELVAAFSATIRKSAPRA